ncbi:hypothetical protein ACFL2E_03785 [Thermodesulfobacteriota bacterium]
MKRYPILILSLLFFLLTLFLGCNTEDSEDENGETNSAATPTITDVVFYKCDDSDKNNPQISNYFNEGDYYYRRIYYKDSDRDIRYLHLTIYIDEEGQFIEYSGPDVSELPSQRGSSGWDEYINARQIQIPSGSYKYQFQVEDEENNMSNKFRVFIVVD